MNPGYAATARADGLDAPLLARVAAGDESAMKECIARFGGLVWSLARRLAPNVSDAEDAVQEIFVDLWKSARRYEPTAASEATFIAMIARRRLIDAARARTRRREEPLDGAAEPTRDATLRVSRSELVAEAALAEKALDQLRPEQRNVLLMAVHGLSNSEIAARTGLPLGTVKAHARRGLLRVREMLAIEGGRT